MVGKRLVNTGEAAPPPFDPLQNFENVTYTGNGGTQKITGYIRKGAAFNGSSSYIDLPDFSSIVSGSSANFSVSLWINLNNLTGNHTLLQLSGNTSSGTSLTLQVNTLGNFYIDNYGAAFGFTGLSSIAANTWYHIVLVNTGSSAVLYVNNSASNTLTHNTTFAGTYSAIGGRFVTGSIYSADLTEGKIDQFRIFNKALDSGEVTTLYGETYASSTKSTTDIFSDGSGVALYELDEDANDTGKYGRGSIDTGLSFSFNGSVSGGSYINPASDPIPSTGAFTVSAWVKTSVSNHCFISFGDFWLKSEYLSGVFGLGDPNPTLQGTTDISDGNWHHCALTVDASNNIVLYVDGVIEDTGTATISRTNGGSFTIGVARVSNRVYYWSGNVDQVKIYSSALSVSDIQELISETNAPTANLVAHYKLDGNVIDETTNHDGTWYGVNAYGSPAEFTTYDGTPTNVNFLGMAFQPDLVWVKARTDTTSHAIFDSVRGASKWLSSNSTSRQETYTDTLTSFDNNGYTVSNSSAVNGNNVNYVAWCWKAGGAAVLNEEGSIDSQVSANKAAGFSIVKYTSTTTSSDTVGHGLSQAPELYITKRLGTAASWWTYSTVIDGTLDYMALDRTMSKNDSSQALPTSSVFPTDYSAIDDIITYCFHSVDGYQKVGTYPGNGTTSNRIYTTNDGTSSGTDGFEPRFLLVKQTNASRNWNIYDNLRVQDRPLFPNLPNAEAGDAERLQFNSDGFTWTNSAADFNALNGTYIYLAIA